MIFKSFTDTNYTILAQGPKENKFFATIGRRIANNCALTTEGMPGSSTNLLSMPMVKIDANFNAPVLRLFRRFCIS